MLAIKDNKEYTVNEIDKKRYLEDGFDIYNEKGEVVEYSPKKMIRFVDHLKKIEVLNGKIEELEETNKKLEETNKKLEKELKEKKQKKRC